jgi:hypothetical protein
MSILSDWPNCSVPDCEYKTALGSDKCFPHTHGWEAVRANLRKRIENPENYMDKIRAMAHLDAISTYR